ncbi:MAG TPA: CBS domain-containing protein, partial [bacterium]|nr:CBS domain-containing protein [bacterium]
GTALIFLGLLTVLRGDFIGGIWWVLIGMFLQNASRMSYRQVLMRRALEGETVARFMNPDPVTVSPDISIEELVNRYVYHHHFKMYPVTDGDSLLGCVTLGKIKEIPREEWARKTVRDLMTSCSRENTISPGTDAMRVLTLMNQAKSGRMMVVDGDKLVGVITLKDLLDFFSIKLDLEGTRDAPGPDRL